MDPEQANAADAARVANVCEAAVLLAGTGGMDVVAAKSITLAFAANGDVEVSLVTTTGEADTATITAADIVAASDLDADLGRDSVPPPPPAA